MLSVTIDGISSVGVEYSGPVNEMFPSFNSIEEIRVSESNNNAEFAGVADITTVSKRGRCTITVEFSRISRTRFLMRTIHLRWRSRRSS